MSDTLDEWTDKAIPAGSGRYYALLHTEAQLQNHQKHIATLISVFSKLGFQSGEIEVAKHKLNWWRIELEKESFQHPVMASLDAPSALTLERIKQLLNAYGSLLENGSPSTDHENQQFHLHTGATACQLLCNTETDIEAVTKAGSTLSQLRCYRYLRQHVDHGLLCLPMSALEAANISPAQLGPDNKDKPVQDFLKDTQNRLLTDLEAALKMLSKHISQTPPEARAQFKSLYIYTHLQTALLQSMAKDNTSALNQITRLTPIKNYWLALRAAWKFDRL